MPARTSSRPTRMTPPSSQNVGSGGAGSTVRATMNAANPSNRTPHRMVAKRGRLRGRLRRGAGAVARVVGGWVAVGGLAWAGLPAPAELPAPAPLRAPAAPGGAGTGVGTLFGGGVGFAPASPAPTGGRGTGLMSGGGGAEGSLPLSLPSAQRARANAAEAGMASVSTGDSRSVGPS